MADITKLLRGADLWDSKYLTAIKAAIAKHQDPATAAQTIRKYLSKESRGDFNLVNPYSRKIMRRELLIAAADLEDALFEVGTVVMLATFADRQWACRDRAIAFDIHAAKQKIRTAMTGMNYLGVFEAALYPGRQWETDGKTGSLVSFHCHAIVWSSSKSKLQRHKATISARFEPIDERDVATFPVLNHIKTMKDLKTVLRYTTKMHFEGYRRVFNNGQPRNVHATLQQRKRAFQDGEHQKRPTEVRTSTGKLAITSAFRWANCIQFFLISPSTYLQADRRMAKLRFDNTDYSVVVKSRAPPPNSWRWGIYRVGRSSPIGQSPIFFRTVAAANKAGKAALKQLLAKLNA